MGRWFLWDKVGGRPVSTLEPHDAPINFASKAEAEQWIARNVPASAVRWAGGVPSDEGLRLVDSTRIALQVPTARNVAFAETVIEGQPRQLLTGVSGRESPPGTVLAPTNR